MVNRWPAGGPRTCEQFHISTKTAGGVHFVSTPPSWWKQTNRTTVVRMLRMLYKSEGAVGAFCPPHQSLGARFRRQLRAHKARRVGLWGPFARVRRARQQTFEHAHLETMVVVTQ
jgi:hypothetical protein